MCSYQAVGEKGAVRSVEDGGLPNRHPISTLELVADSTSSAHELAAGSTHQSIISPRDRDVSTSSAHELAAGSNHQSIMSPRDRDVASLEQEVERLREERVRLSRLQEITDRERALLARIEQHSG
jgi:hypothetical protein